MQEGPVVRGALGRERHGQWIIGVSTFEKLGGKTKYSEYYVVEVEQFGVVNQQP